MGIAKATLKAIKTASNLVDAEWKISIEEFWSPFAFSFFKRLSVCDFIYEILHCGELVIFLVNFHEQLTAK